MTHTKGILQKLGRRQNSFTMGKGQQLTDFTNRKKDEVKDTLIGVGRGGCTGSNGRGSGKLSTPLMPSYANEKEGFRGGGRGKGGRTNGG